MSTNVGNRFGRWRLRAPTSVVIDTPFEHPGPVGWAAILWPTTDGWARQLWRPDGSGRGWALPHELAAGDVVEFGYHTPAGPAAWWGILISYEYDAWVTVQGPYRDPSDAHAAAQRLLAPERFLPPLGTPAPKDHAGHRRARRRPTDRCR